MTTEPGAGKPQRQDSVTDQLMDVIALAESEGCYDAADWIKGFMRSYPPRLSPRFRGCQGSDDGDDGGWA